MDSSTATVAIIAALIGSTGIAGFLTAGVQWTRSARLRRAIEAHAKLIEAVGKKTAGGRALERANQADALRLSAVSLLRPPQALWQMVFILIVLLISFILMLGGILVMTPVGEPEIAARMPRVWYGAFIGLVVGYIVAVVFTLDSLIRVRRERFVRAVMRSGKFTSGAVRNHDFATNKRDDDRHARLLKRRAEERRQAAAK